MKFRAILTLLALALAGTASAQTNETPYWASIRVGEAFMRVGPSASYPIDWVYSRAGLPLRVVRVNQGWRLVEDPDGIRGWISASLLSRTRGAIVVGEGLAAMRAEPSGSAPLKWNLEPGVVGELGNCSDGWCELDVAGHEGFVEQARLWGAGEP
jgi:SH3-like domain-containing protein